ncbi:hypothetical protein ACFL4T_09440 [candidate division KSB1 bacterium]
MKKILLLLSVFILFLSCSTGEGLKPPSHEVEEPTGISGKVTFIGNWPVNPLSYMVAVGVLTKYPPDDIMDISAYTDPITPNTTEFDYFLELSPGTYAGVVAALVNYADLLHPVMLGFYKTGENDTTPAIITIVEGKTTKNMDITADFSLIGKLKVLY